MIDPSDVSVKAMIRLPPRSAGSQQPIDVNDPATSTPNVLEL
jgi:hypothetical protein